MIIYLHNNGSANFKEQYEPLILNNIQTLELKYENEVLKYVK